MMIRDGHQFAPTPEQEAELARAQSYLLRKRLAATKQAT